MLVALLALSALSLLLTLIALLRKPTAQADPHLADPHLADTHLADPRLMERLEASATALSTHLTRIEAGTDARITALDTQLRSTVHTIQGALSEIRNDAAADAHHHRETTQRSAADLREEITRIITHLGNTLASHLSDFHTHSSDAFSKHRADTNVTAENLRSSVKQDLEAIGQRLSHFIAETTRHQTDSREALHTRLSSLGDAQTTHQDKLRATVEDRLNHLNTTNALKLDEMRQTVDEKLHATLHSRLTESFGQVTDQLTKVHSGLGEMSKLSAGVDDLSRIFTNVKSRGGFAEVQLGMLLAQMLAPSQFVKNARVKPHTMEVVEFAVKFPSHSGETLLPIDAKFPREDWERLELAYTEGSADQIASAGKSFEAAIRTEGKRICEKYIEPPVTTPHAIMFLPTEGLYAEVMRREGLQAEIQSKCRVTIAGPSTLSAILTSFQMGFHMLAIQEKGSEVWDILAKTRSEFTKFEDLMGSMEKQVGTVQNTIQKLNVRSRAINKTLREVGEPEGASNLLSFESPTPGLAPLLAATADEAE